MVEMLAKRYRCWNCNEMDITIENKYHMVVKIKKHISESKNPLFNTNQAVGY